MQYGRSPRSVLQRGAAASWPDRHATISALTVLGSGGLEKLAHLAAFVSLIYGLGVANVLGHIASLIKRSRRSDWYWIHTLWTLCLLLMMASFWWLLQNWAPVSRISFLSYLSLLLIPSLLYVASDLLFPDRDSEEAIDLRTHFFRIRKPLFLIVLGVLMADELDSLLKGWEHVVALGPYYWGTQVFGYVACLTGFHSHRERTQGVLVSLLLLVFVGGMINALAWI